MNPQGKDICDVIDVTDTITHDEFVGGVQNKTIGFKAIKGESITLVKGARKIIFNILVMLYTIGPPLLIPLWVYREGNWWLLIGIAVSWITTAATANSASVAIKGKTVGGTLLLACVMFWIRNGIHNYFTFFSLSALWGCVLFQIAENTQCEYAMQSLIESPELFRRAIAQERIRVVRRRRSL